MSLQLCSEVFYVDSGTNNRLEYYVSLFLRLYHIGFFILFQSYQTYKEHLAIHTHLFECKHCNKRFRKKYLLNQHGPHCPQKPQKRSAVYPQPKSKPKSERNVLVDVSSLPISKIHTFHYHIFKKVSDKAHDMLLNVYYL